MSNVRQKERETVKSTLSYYTFFEETKKSDYVPSYSTEEYNKDIKFVVNSLIGMAVVSTMGLGYIISIIVQGA